MNINTMCGVGMALHKIIALVGMMGAGKSSLGRRLAMRLDVPFFDADIEIAKAAGCSIPEIFTRYGEKAFRDCERKVLARLLTEPPHILATGGGAFMDETTRNQIRQHAVSMWITAPVDVLVSRVQRKGGERPLLKEGDPCETLTRLLAEREPFYRQADLTVVSENVPHAETVEHMVQALKQFGVCEEV